MNFIPSEKLNESQINSGLKLLVKDGLAAEIMATLTGGAFLVALAIKMGASNFQIGLMASLPTLASLFQLAAIYLVYKSENRKLITVFSSILGRLPLLIIGILPFIFSLHTSLNMMIFLLFFHHFFGSISGASWNSWMKDLVPQKKLGTYFSHRSRLIQILNVVLSFAVAYLLDYVRTHQPGREIETFSYMFITGSIFGLIGVAILSNIPEPKMYIVKKQFLRLFKKPLRRRNFRNLLIFHGIWAFAINLAAPFFTVYLLKWLELPLSYVVGLTIISQITNILFIRVWGRYSDKYSNKSILRICAPLYIACILAWTFTTLPDKHAFTIPLLVIIHIISGISISGINLSLGNIGMKLAPKGDAIVYLSVRSMMTAACAAIAPLAGGLFADFFATRELSWTINWKSPGGNFEFYTLDLQQWDFFFAISVIVALIALYRLSFVKEEGETKEKVIMTEIKEDIAKGLRAYSTVTGLRSMIYLPSSFIQLVRKKRQVKKDNKLRLPEKLKPQREPANAAG